MNDCIIGFESMLANAEKEAGGSIAPSFVPSGEQLLQI